LEDRHEVGTVQLFSGIQRTVSDTRFRKFRSVACANSRGKYWQFYLSVGIDVGIISELYSKRCGNTSVFSSTLLCGISGSKRTITEQGPTRREEAPLLYI